MKAVILAGGEGTRLRPLTLQVPKPVVPIANVPFLGYQLDLLRRHGISEAILSLGYRPDRIEAELGDGSRFGIRLRYVVEQSPLGTGGAFKNAEPFLDGPAVVFNGDILCDFDLTEILRSHRRRSAAATLTLTRVDNPSAYGLVETGGDGRVARFLEKPGRDQVTCDTINAGLYVLEPEVLKTIPAGVNTSFERTVFPGLVAGGRPVFAYISPGYWIDIGTPQKYLQAHRDIFEGRFAPPAAAFRFSPAGPPDPAGCSALVRNSVVAASARLGSQSRILGSAVDRDCQVGDGAIIEDSVLWKGVQVGEGARLRGCILGNGCRIGSHAVVGDGVVLGDDSRLSANGRLLSA